MKKILFATMVITAMAVGCQEAELENGAISNGEVFKISAALPETKTTFDPDGYQVAWEADDELTVIINSNDAYKFTKSADANDFEATGVSLQEGVNTYFAIYPYSEDVKSIESNGETNTFIPIPVKHNVAQIQSISGNTDHIKGVMYGKVDSEVSESPVIQMHQMTSIFKILIKNPAEETIHIQSITFSTDAPDAVLSGTFYVSEKGEIRGSGDKYVANATVLTVTDGAIAPASTGEFWLATTPFAVPEGNKVIVTILADEGEVTVERTAPAGGWNFEAGTVNTMKDVVYEGAETIEYMTVSELLAAVSEMQDGSEVNVEGIVAAKNARSYILIDEANQSEYILAYKNSEPSEVKIGDLVQISGNITEYAQMMQIQNPIVNKVISNSSVSYPTPDILDGDAADALVASPERKFIQFTGTLSISGSHYNVTIDGASTAVGSISYPAEDLSAYNGKPITLTGYFNGVSGSRYLNIFITSINAAPYCDVAPASLSVNSEAGSTQFTVSANESWTITSSNSAYKVSPASGKGDATIEVLYPENAEAEAVEVIFTIKSATTEKTITLIQSAAGASIEPTELFISEYVEGSSNNKYIEIYNPTSQAIDLSGYSIVMHNFNKEHSFSQDLTMELSGSIEAGATVVYAHSKATAYSGTVILGENDNVMNFNGNDPVSLYHNGVEIDRFGPANDAVSGDFAKDHTYRRVSSVIAPSNVWVETEWEELGKDNVSDLGKHTMNK